eukprot:TRINITY_DN5624_c0_g1_i1.p1 TRINITY_DN5624_c0_g1~~TRINITY_DN5624_c0_g1_i1.p1  ORF type:complete len:549 (+),score=165.14 TRINITY_DN5624_c0_g1_i1:49-1695(+)
MQGFGRDQGFLPGGMYNSNYNNPQYNRDFDRSGNGPPGLNMNPVNYNNNHYHSIHPPAANTLPHNFNFIPNVVSAPQNPSSNLSYNPINNNMNNNMGSSINNINNNNLDIPIKLYYNNDIRRIRLEAISWELLLRKVTDVFHLSPSQVVIRYDDDEGDKITISTIYELTEAIQLTLNKPKPPSEPLNTLKLFITINSIQNSNQNSDQMIEDSTPNPSTNTISPPLPPPRHYPHRHHHHHHPHKRHFHDIDSNSDDQNLNPNPNPSDSTSPPSSSSSTDTYSPSYDKRILKKQFKEHIKEQRQEYKQMKSQYRESLKHQKHILRCERKLHKSSASPPNPNNPNSNKDFSYLVSRDQYGNKIKRQYHKARFVKHVSIPDDTIFSPKQSFIKSWRFRNEGRNPWPEDTELMFVSKREGDIMGAEPRVMIERSRVNPGEEVDVNVNMIAPEESGWYVGYWRLVSGEQKFGQRVWVKIQVVKEEGKPEVKEEGQMEEKPLREYYGSLRQLQEMGWEDLERNVELLKRNGNDVAKVGRILKEEEEERNRGGNRA